MLLWLDDIRTPPSDEWIWVKTIEEAQEHLATGEVEEASLDNDLGENVPEGRKLVLWMCEYEIWPSLRLTIHSANTVASPYMVGMIERYGPFKKVTGRPEFLRRAP